MTLLKLIKNKDAAAPIKHSACRRLNPFLALRGAHPQRPVDLSQLQTVQLGQGKNFGLWLPFALPFVDDSSFFIYYLGQSVVCLLKL